VWINNIYCVGYNVKRYTSFRIMYLGYYVLGTGIRLLWRERFPSDDDLLSFDTMQICGITTMFWTNMLPLCSGLQNYSQGNGVISCVSKIAVMCNIASSACNVALDSCWLQCIQALYEVWNPKDVPWWYPSPSTVFHNRAHNQWLYLQWLLWNLCILTVYYSL
jgi:hypothetical protein